MLNWFLRRSPSSTDAIEPAEARQHQTEGALLIDVREPDEWAAGHAPKARHIPLGQLEQQLGTLPRNRELLFICRSGARSAQAMATARRAGLTTARNVRGGLLAWQRAGLPVER